MKRYKAHKKIKDFPAYAISREGEIIRTSRGARTYTGRKMNLTIDSHGYYSVSLYKNNKPHTRRVHTLLALTYLGERPFKYEINHKDGNKLNNRVSNLEYLTKKKNMQHAFSLGLIPRRTGRANFCSKDVPIEIVRILNVMGLTQRRIAELLKVSKGTVWSVIKGKHWRCHEAV